MTSQTAPSDHEIEDIHNVEYTRIGDRALYLKISSPKVRPTSPMPAVFWIHGGGWREGDYTDNWARVLAGRGYFTASIRYRPSEEAVWPAQIEDCRQAVRWLRAHAADYNVDPARIGAWGASAGGHLALCLGCMDERAGLMKDDPPGSSRVQAVVDWCGPSDFLIGRSTGYTQYLGELFGDPNVLQDEQRLRNASPLTWIGPGNPPCLIVHGDCDLAVSYAESVEAKAAMDKAGVPAQLFTIHGGVHNFGPMHQGPPVPDRATILSVVFDFLDRTLRQT
jgi:acetyl esterase/lipase